MRAILAIAVVVGSAAVAATASGQWYGHGYGAGVVDPRVGTPYPNAVPYGAHPQPYGYGYGVAPPAAPAPYWQGQAVPPGTPAMPYGTDGHGRSWTENPANPGFVTPGARQRCVGQGAARTCW